jgi:hypothetical protein
MKSTHEYVEAHQGESLDRAIPGFTTSTKTRPLVVAKLEEFIRNKMLTTYSSRLYHEFKTFIWNNGKPQAMRSYNDDLIMAIAIGCWVKDTALQVNKREVEYKKAMISSMYKSDSIMNTTIKGMKGYNESIKEKQKDFKEQLTQHSWIYKG